MIFATVQAVYFVVLSIPQNFSKQTKQNKTKQSQRVSVGSIKCIVIYLTVRNRSRWKRTQQEVSRHLRSSLKKSAFGERRFYIQLPHITNHQGHAIRKVPCSKSNTFKIRLKRKWTSNYTIIHIVSIRNWKFKKISSSRTAVFIYQR